ncbi:Uu.00g140140.m01.CDS01 [Anthostomella pinea]|uniref:Uu.00g140140.m01.CDS01 n=1 Tax=Anthostomella pinea TaxID=933095 RepID=A0AAI8YL84_9PEZI|nr:Uu.00g140140.m01.CDS01 [Anthostomella pinea]
MLRRLWAGSRVPARSLSSNIGRQLHSPPTGRSRISQHEIPRHGPRTHTNHRPSKLLQAGIYGSIYTSIGFLVLNEALDWPTRKAIGVETVQSITLEEDEEIKCARFWETGQSLFEAYTGCEEVEHHGPVRLLGDPDQGWLHDDVLQTRTMTAPDPEKPGGTIFLFLGVLLDPEDVYITEYGNRLTDATEAILPALEEFARERKVGRGVFVLLENGGEGNWKSVYFDGTRWINVVYLEWQTAESLGLY